MIVREVRVDDVEGMCAVDVGSARTSIELRLPMADALILATARVHEATLWTQDVDFRDIEGVRYLARQV